MYYTYGYNCATYEVYDYTIIQRNMFTMEKNNVYTT